LGRNDRVSSQLLNSASSALFSIGLVAATDDAELGAIAIQMTALPVLLGVGRTAVFESVLLKTSGEVRERAVWLPAAAGMLLGVVAALTTVLVGVLVDSPWGTSIAVSSVSFAVIAFDGLRFSAFASGRDRLARGADALWLGLAVGALAIVVTRDALAPATMGWSYVSGALLGALAFIPLLRGLHRSPLPHGFRRELRFGWDFVLQAAPGQAALVVGAVVSDLSAVGSIRAAVTLFSPLATLVYAVRLIVIDQHTSISWSPTVVYSSLSALYAAFVVTIFWAFEGFAVRMLGALPIVLLGLVGVGELFRHVAQARIDHARSMGQLRRVLRARSLQASSLVALSAALGAMGGATGLGAARAGAFATPLPLLRSERRIGPSPMVHH
jgi:hypothetical protein